MSVNRKVTVPRCSGSASSVIRASRLASVSVRLRSGRAADRRARAGWPAPRVGCSRDDGLEVPASRGRGRRSARRDDLGDARLAVEHGQLPEELARAQPGDRPPRRARPGPTRRDDEEARPDLALAGDDASAGTSTSIIRSAIRSSPSASTPANRRVCDRQLASCGRGSGSSSPPRAQRRHAAPLGSGPSTGARRAVAWRSHAFWHHAVMADREELVDAIAGFSAVRRPDRCRSSQGIVHLFEEAVFAEGERVLRQGLTGSGFYVILDGEAAIVIDGTEARPPGPRRLLRRGLDHPRRVADRRRRGAPAAALPRARRPAGRAVPGRPPAGDVPDAPGPGAPAAGGEPMAELNRPPRRHPSRPASIRSSSSAAGPGAIQVSYSLRRLGVDHAVISADPSPGGMFRRWPFFQRLLSWTKPHAPVDARHAAPTSATTGTACWARSPARGPSSRRSWTASRTSRRGRRWKPTSRPSRSGPGSTIRYGCRWTGTRPTATAGRRRASSSRRPTASTAAGVAGRRGRRRRAVHAAGRRAWSSTHHYAEVRPAETYADRRVFIIGKQNSGFELATGLLPWARQLVLSSPSPARLSVETKSLVGVRARYVQPYEDYVAGWRRQRPGRGHRPDRAGRGRRLTVHLRRTDGGADLAIEVDEVDLRDRLRVPAPDLPDLGVATFGPEPAARPDARGGRAPACPASSSRGRSARASKGLQKHGVPGQLRRASTAPATTPGSSPGTSRRHSSGCGRSGRASPPMTVDRFIATELAEAPELFHQRGYLARVLTADPAGRAARRRRPAAGIRARCGWAGCRSRPRSRPTDPGRSIRSSTRGSGGKIVEQAIEPDPLMRVDTVDLRRLIAELVGRVMTR